MQIPPLKTTDGWADPAPPHNSRDCTVLLILPESRKEPGSAEEKDNLRERRDGRGTCLHAFFEL